jgi:hypothetical protein
MTKELTKVTKIHELRCAITSLAEIRNKLYAHAASACMTESIYEPCQRTIQESLQTIFGAINECSGTAAIVASRVEAIRQQMGELKRTVDGYVQSPSLRESLYEKVNALEQYDNPSSRLHAWMLSRFPPILMESEPSENTVATAVKGEDPTAIATDASGFSLYFDSERFRSHAFGDVVEKVTFGARNLILDGLGIGAARGAGAPVLETDRHKYVGLELVTLINGQEAHLGREHFELIKDSIGWSIVALVRGSETITVDGIDRSPVLVSVYPKGLAKKAAAPRVLLSAESQVNVPYRLTDGAEIFLGNYSSKNRAYLIRVNAPTAALGVPAAGVADVPVPVVPGQLLLTETPPGARLPVPPPPVRVGG